MRLMLIDNDKSDETAISRDYLLSTKERKEIIGSKNPTRISDRPESTEGKVSSNIKRGLKFLFKIKETLSKRL